MIRALVALVALVVGCGGAAFVAGESSEDAGDDVELDASSDVGHLVDANADTQRPIEAGARDVESDVVETSTPDPDTHACGSSSATDRPAPKPGQWWASVGHTSPDGTWIASYCDPMSSTPPPAAYTCAAILAVWNCQAWQGIGTTLGCHPNTLTPSVLQVDCEVP